MLIIFAGDRQDSREVSGGLEKQGDASEAASCGTLLH